MSATVADLNPKTLENAKRNSPWSWRSALVMNTYLKIALVLVSLVAWGSWRSTSTPPPNTP